LASSAYAHRVAHVWWRIMELTDMPPVTLPGVGRFGAYCPVDSCDGTVLIEILDNPVRVRFSGDAWDGTKRPRQCSNGCTVKQIRDALA
jgi:hypothetical protein